MTSFPKNTAVRASDSKLPFGLHLKREKNPTRSIQASGWSSAWQVHRASHQAGNSRRQSTTPSFPPPGKRSGDNLVLALSGKS